MGRHVKGRCRRCGARLTLPLDPEQPCALCRLARALLANRPPVEPDGKTRQLPPATADGPVRLLLRFACTRVQSGRSALTALAAVPPAHREVSLKCGWIAVVATLPLLLAGATHAEAQAVAEFGRVEYERSKLLNMQADAPAVDLGTVDNLTNRRDLPGYMVHIGLYGAVNPSIYPSKTWLNVACMSTPGKSYRGFSLVYVDVLLYNGARRVWNSSVQNRDRGICDVNDGVDTTFVEVPRGLPFTAWDVFITPAEQRRRQVVYTKTVYPVKLY